MEIYFRRRINVSQTAKGVKTFEATVESADADLAELLAESDKLVAELDKRYPAVAEEKTHV